MPDSQQNLNRIPAEIESGLWAIETDAIHRLLPPGTAANGLFIGLGAHRYQALQSPLANIGWSYDPSEQSGNAWLSDNISRLPLQDDCLELVIIRHCLDSGEEARHVVYDVCRVLKPGGHALLCCLNTRGWLAAATLRKKHPPSLAMGWIRTAAVQAGLEIERCRSIGFGRIGGKWAGSGMPRMISPLSNLHVCMLRKPGAAGDVRRLVYRLPRRGRAVAAETGLYSKTGT